MRGNLSVKTAYLHILYLCKQILPVQWVITTLTVPGKQRKTMSDSSGYTLWQRLKLPRSARLLVCMKQVHGAQLYGPCLKIQWGIGGEGEQDKRRRRDCNENAIICIQTDIILPLDEVRCGSSKKAFSQLSIWIWLTTVTHQEIQLKYWEWITTWLPLMSSYWSPLSTPGAPRIRKCDGERYCGSG